LNEFLKAFDGYFPWVIIFVLALSYRGVVKTVIQAIGERISSGSELELSAQGASLKLGELIRNTQDAKDQALDEGTGIEVYGNPDQLKLLFKVQGVGWKKSTKALPVPGGCIVQMTTERQGSDGTWSTSEAMQFIPNATVVASSAAGEFSLGRLDE
jgi:hypothetical protein